MIVTNEIWGINKKLEIGDKITAQGFTFEIAKIYSQEHYTNSDGSEEWFVEFKDPQGRIHSWQSFSDGGRVIPR